MSFNPLLPLVAPNCISQVVVSFLTQTQIAQVSVFYRTSAVGPLTNVRLAQLVAAFAAACNGALANCLSPQSVISQVRAADSSGGIVTTQFTNYATAGTAGATALPGPNAAVITKYTLFRGKRGRGRIYMPAIPNTFTTPATDPNLINVTGTTAYTALRVALNATIATLSDTWVPVVASRPDPGSNLYTRCADTTGWVTEFVLGTIRRRREGRGI